MNSIQFNIIILRWQASERMLRVFDQTQCIVLITFSRNRYHFIVAFSYVANLLLLSVRRRHVSFYKGSILMYQNLLVFYCLVNKDNYIFVFWDVNCSFVIFIIMLFWSWCRASGVVTCSRCVWCRLLNDNRIELIDRGVFDNMTSLEVLKLNKNKLHSLLPAVFNRLDRLRHLWALQFLSLLNKLK